MRLLILGGTRFVGRHIAEAALAQGWDLTLFNRGVSDPDAFPAARHLVGDRDGGLGALADGSWDLVVDTCGYVPRVVRASAELLAPRTTRYVFISSASAYADLSRPGATEEAPAATLEDPASEDVAKYYGELKAACEATVRQVMGADRAVIVRPGLIVGPHDPTNRFTYWVTRIARGGEVLAPQPRDQSVQVIDARDLAAWVTRLADAEPGTYNAVGDVTTMDGVLATIAAATNSDARLHWVEEQRLLAAGVEPWSDVPLWLAPGSDPSSRGFLSLSNAKAKAAGLELRPLAETVRDTLAWAKAAPAPTGDVAGLDPEVERRLLAPG
jgi:2'-hydroxyisoflavone reductase